jgi:transposase/uncharacterized coiled-coil protein SlyX
MILTLSQAENLLVQKDLHIAQQEAQIDQLTIKLLSTQRQLTTLQHQMEQMIRRVYGRKSEKIDPGQLMFDSIILESVEQSADVAQKVEAPAVSKPRKKRIRHGRIPIPEHLEQVEIFIDVPEEQRVHPVTGEPLALINVEISEKLEYRPGRLFVNVYKRPQYALPENVGVLCAPMPDQPIDRCKADTGLLAHVIVSKFADHLPLYRQDGIFKREGVDIPRTTQSGWLMQIYENIKPLEETLRLALFEDDVLFTDDTPIPLQIKGNGKLKKARLWVYVRGAPPLTLYDFSVDRSKERPLHILKGYRGYVHADAYSGYDALFRRSGIVEVGCWAHARRKFDEASSSRPVEATDILARIARLYHEVETPCKEKSAEERHLFRQEQAVPILTGIFDQLEQLHSRTIPSEPLRKAVDYALNQRTALCRYIEDGRLRPDNNLAENAMRPAALGRKNWLFVGSERAGRATALYMSLIQSCKDNDINPWEYFNDMLRRIMTHPVTRLRELLPDRWTPIVKG